MRTETTDDKVLRACEQIGIPQQFHEDVVTISNQQLAEYKEKLKEEIKNCNEPNANLIFINRVIELIDTL